MNLVQGVGYISQSVVHKPWASDLPGGGSGDLKCRFWVSAPHLKIVLRGWAQDLAYLASSPGNSAAP